MKKMKYALAVGIFVVFAAFSVSAAEFKEEISIDNVQGIVTVIGTHSASRANKTITVQVEKEKKEGTEIAYVNQIKADETGSFTLKFYLMSSGKYTLHLAENGETGIASSSFFFAFEQSQTVALEEINNATRDTIVQVMENEDVQNAMNLGDLYYNLLESSVDMTSIYYQIVDHDDFATSDAFSLWFQQNVFVYALDKNDVNDGENAMNILENYGNELGVLQWKGYSYYKNFDIAQREEIGKKLSSKNICVFADVEKKYDEAVFIEYIKKCESYGKINVLFKDIRDSGKNYDLDLTKYFSLSNTVDVDKGICGKSYANMKELQSALDTFVEARAKMVENANVSTSSPSRGEGRSINNAFSVNTSTDINTPPITNDGNNNAVAPFHDLDEAEWAKESILYLYDKKIISDDPSKEFRPNDNVTREEFAKMLVVAFNLPTAGADSYFTDVNTFDWCYPYISAGYCKGLLNGVGDGLFGTGQNINRMDAAVMAYRFACYDGMEFLTEGEAFSDSDAFADYAAEPIQAMKNKTIINGYSENTFEPYNALTRAEAAKILHKLLEEGYYEK